MSKGPDVIFLKEGMVIPSYKDTKAIKEIQSQENYVDFGTVTTLKEKPMTILLKNISPIEATYTAFMKTPGSIFYVKNPKDRIKAGETKLVEMAYLPFKMRLYSLSLPSTSMAFCMPGSTEAITW